MYRISNFSPKKLFYVFSTKTDGSLSFNFHSTENVVDNRLKFFANAGINSQEAVGMLVEHKDNVVRVGKSDKGKGILSWKSALKCDSIITSEKKMYLFLLIADCIPVILYDPDKPAVGLVHVGWKGSDLNIVGKTVAKMKEEFKTNPKDLVAMFGPYAHKDSFTKKNPSQIKDTRWQPFLEKTGEGLYKIDFAGLCKKQLKEAGVLKENIIDCGIDTVKDKRFFSHVREHNLPKEKQGRFGCVIGLL